jgi:hypothetical protein
MFTTSGRVQLYQMVHETYIINRDKMRIPIWRRKIYRVRENIIVLDNLTIVEYIYFKKPARSAGPVLPPRIERRGTIVDTPRLHATHSPADETCGAAARSVW